MSKLGAKADNLLRMQTEFELNVPPFIAIAFEDLILEYKQASNSLESLVNDFLNSTKSLEETSALIAQQLSKVKLDKEQLGSYFEAIAANSWAAVSFRTSAAVEDGGADSFAGQYQSFVDQEFTYENLEKYALLCFGSMVSSTVINYAKERGLTQFNLGGSVIVQEMFYGDTSGVLFTENGSGELQIALTNSWQNTVVEGEDASELLVNRLEIDSIKMPRQLRELCKAALVIEAKVGRPLDIEFSYDSQVLTFLQFRPITKPMLEYSFDWDSSNISENYPGITLPLTYSVIRQFYGSVYLSFFKMLGASKKDIADKAPITQNMLGYLDGHVYYRITNWYEGIKLVPGRRNQEYFEAMLNPVKKRGEAAKSRMDLKSIIAITRFLILLLRSEGISKRFSKRIAKKISFYDAINVDYINAASLLQSGKKIRQEMLEDWAVTILNDVRLMVFHGILKRLFAKSDNPDDYMLLMQGLNDKASIRPLESLSNLGLVVQEALQNEAISEIAKLEQTDSWSKVKDAAEEYINEFGARTPGELKLENERLTDRLFTVLELALKAANSGIDSSPSSDKRVITWPTNQSPFLRPLVLLVAKNTRRAIDWRERFRFNRAQTFNLSRKSFDAIGKALAAEGLLAEPRDIYWLTDTEVDELVNTHAPIQDGKTIVAMRKMQFEQYEKKEKALAVHGTGRIAGMHQVNIEPVSLDGSISGKGVAPGEITAEVIVVKEFDPTVDVRGKVLVVHYIDPGWTLLFTQAAGIVAERGNALSHAAIIAREIGIPAIVAAPNATKDLNTGDVVTINGSTGVIKHESL
jgi:pyruvate,water dikinase